MGEYLDRLGELRKPYFYAPLRLYQTALTSLSPLSILPSNFSRRPARHPWVSRVFVADRHPPEAVIHCSRGIQPLPVGFFSEREARARENSPQKLSVGLDMGC